MDFFFFMIAKSQKQFTYPTTWEHLMNADVSIKWNSYSQLFSEK